MFLKRVILVRNRMFGIKVQFYQLDSFLSSFAKENKSNLKVQMRQELMAAGIEPRTSRPSLVLLII